MRELYDRLVSAELELTGLATIAKLRGDLDTATHLDSKADGVRLAKSYVFEEMRNSNAN